MNPPEPSMRSITIPFPTTGLAQIDLCAQRSGLSAAKFCTVALTLGARIQVISLEPVASLPASLRKQAAQSANTNITPESLVRLVSQEKAAPQVDSAEGPDGLVAVAVAPDVVTQLERLAHMTEIDLNKLHALALATGVQMLASSLAPESSVPLDLLLKMSEGPLSPDTVAKSFMDRQEHLRSRRGSQGHA